MQNFVILEEETAFVMQGTKIFMLKRTARTVPWRGACEPHLGSRLGAGFQCSDPAAGDTAPSLHASCSNFPELVC